MRSKRYRVLPVRNNLRIGTNCSIQLIDHDVLDNLEQVFVVITAAFAARFIAQKNNDQDAPAKYGRWRRNRHDSSRAACRHHNGAKEGLMLVTLHRQHLWCLLRRDQS